MQLHMQKQLPLLFLKLLEVFEDFRDMTQNETFPQLYAEIESYKINPRCTCKNRIMHFAEMHRQVVAQHIEQWHAHHAHVTLLDEHGRIALY